MHLYQETNYRWKINGKADIDILRVNLLRSTSCFFTTSLAASSVA